MSDCVILIATNDQYIKSFGEIWWKCFRKYWPSCPYPAYFVTPFWKQNSELPIINTGTDYGWNRRTLVGLEEICHRHSPESILLLHEDFLVGPEKAPGDFNKHFQRCIEILRRDPNVCTIGCVRKDPEISVYDGWPEMLGVHDLAPGILPVDPAGISLWRTNHLRGLIEHCISITKIDQDRGRNGVAEFSFQGAIRARDRKELHLRVKRDILYPDGILHILFGVSIGLGRLNIQDQKHLALVEDAIGRPISEMPEMELLMSNVGLKL